MMAKTIFYHLEKVLLQCNRPYSNLAGTVEVLKPLCLPLQFHLVRRRNSWHYSFHGLLAHRRQYIFQEGLLPMWWCRKIWLSPYHTFVAIALMWFEREHSIKNLPQWFVCKSVKTRFRHNSGSTTLCTCSLQELLIVFPCLWGLTLLPFWHCNVDTKTHMAGHIVCVHFSTCVYCSSVMWAVSNLVLCDIRIYQCFR